jgi:hypothetical protein
MHPQSEQIQQRLLQVTQGMDPAALLRHPEGKWSTAEIVEHLSRTYSATSRVLQKCLDAGHPIASPPTLYQRLAIFVVTGLAYFPGGRKAPAFSIPTGIAAEQALPDALANLAQMDDLISQCEARHGSAIPIADHSILGPLKSDQWRKFHWVHARHHVRQIERLRGAG